MRARLHEAAQAVKLCLAGDEIRALGYFDFEVEEIDGEPCTWAMARKDGIITITPKAAGLSDAALVELLAHEVVGHLGIYRSGGRISDEEAAIRRAASRGFGLRLLRGEIKALRANRRER